MGENKGYPIKHPFPRRAAQPRCARRPPAGNGHLDLVQDISARRRMRRMPARTHCPSLQSKGRREKKKGKKGTVRLSWDIRVKSFSPSGRGAPFARARLHDSYSGTNASLCCSVALSFRRCRRNRRRHRVGDDDAFCSDSCRRYRGARRLSSRHRSAARDGAAAAPDNRLPAD